MRHILWLIPALLLFSAIGAQVARADNYVYTYTLTAGTYSLTWTTNPMAAVTTQIDIPAANLASYSVTGSSWASYTLSVASLYLTGATCVGGCVGGVQDTQFKQPPSAFISSIADNSEGLTLADYSTPGTYTHTGSILVDDYTCCGTFTVSGTDTLTVTDVPVSSFEPSTFSLVLIGLGSVWLMTVMRKREARGLPHAT